ncbi:Uncharacterised protein [Streptococcus pneumoniae]|nr:Uncharacterised protein [Streptococcus pneumoniae]
MKRIIPVKVSLTTALQILITFSFNVFIVFPSDLFFCYFLKLDLIIVGVSCSVNKFFTKTQQRFSFSWISCDALLTKIESVFVHG